MAAFSQGSGQIRSRKIKEIITIEFKEENGAESRKIQEQFDKKGRLIERKVYRSNGELRFHKKIQYLDRFGSNQETVFDLPSGKVKSVTRTWFNKWHEEIKMEKCDGQGTIDQSKVWEYDKKGKLIHQVTFGKEGKILQTRTLKYDIRGMILSDTTTDAFGKVIEQTSLEYTY